MDSLFKAGTVSRKDLSEADGIHLLWTPPHAAGYSVTGYNIQRRKSAGGGTTGGEVRDCRDLTSDEITVLQKELSLETEKGIIRLRTAPCPTAVTTFPDEPYDNSIRFSTLPAGFGSNPRIERAISFEVKDANDNPAGNTVIRTSGKFTGLDCGRKLEIELPFGARWVDITLMHASKPATVDAFNDDGTIAGTALMNTQPHQSENFNFQGPAIKSVIITAPENETLLLAFAFGGTGILPDIRQTNIDFQVLPVVRGPNPRTEQSVTFRVLDSEDNVRPKSRVRTTGQFTGLDCEERLEITLPLESSLVELTLLVNSKRVRIRALSSDGSVLQTAKMEGPQTAPQTFKLEAPGINRIVVVTNQGETLLLKLSVAEQPDSPAFADSTRNAEPTRAPAIVEIPPDIFPGVQTCFVYDITLQNAQEFIAVTLDTPIVMAITLKDGKAVDKKISESGEVEFTKRLADQVLLYTNELATKFQFCVLRPSSNQEQEWDSVPYLVRGIQLPFRVVNATLTSPEEEQALATQRILAGESFESSDFAEVAAVANAAAAIAGRSSPMWQTLLTRDSETDPFIELRAWPYVLSLLVDPAWRRILGFGYLDNDNLEEFGSYDYRITAEFRHRDVSEQLLGFHTIPSGLTLPESFHLGSVLLQTIEQCRIELFPPVPDTALRAFARKGIAIGSDLSGEGNVRITFPNPVDHVILEFEPDAVHDLRYEASPSQYIVTTISVTFEGEVPKQHRVEITFPKPVSLLRLTGRGFLYGIRLTDFAAGTAPDQLVLQEFIIRRVIFRDDPIPPAPSFLGTLNLQAAMESRDPRESSANPPKSPGFRLRWIPPPSDAATDQTIWPADISAFPPMDVIGFNIERRRVDVGAPFGNLDEEEPPTLFFGNRGKRPEPAQLYPGINLLDVYPDIYKPQPPISVFAEAEDVLVGLDNPPPLLGGIFQYRIFSVDAIGRRSPEPTVGSMARLEKRIPPPQPVGPPPPPQSPRPNPDDPPGPPLPEPPPAPLGVRARVLRKTDPNLLQQDRDLLGAHDNAVVVEWGWTEQERLLDPFAREFRIYWQPIPPDTIIGSLIEPAVIQNNLFVMQADLNQPVQSDAMKGRYIDAGGYPFKIASHTGGSNIAIQLEPSLLDQAITPAAGNFQVNIFLSGSELRPANWPDRVDVKPITNDSSYEYVFYDRLVLNADNPLARVWVGVSAADGESYIPDEFPAGRPNSGRSGNESSIAAVPAQAHYIGRPLFVPPPPLADVPEEITDEPTGDAISFELKLNDWLPAVTIPAGHSVWLERLAVDSLIAVIGANDDDTLRIKLPDGSSLSYRLANRDDHALFMEQVRTATPGRIDNKFLRQTLIDNTIAFEDFWHPVFARPVAFGSVTVSLPNKAERYLFRVRLADVARHLSAESALLNRVVRVPNLRVTAPPEIEVARHNGGGIVVTARVLDAYDLKAVLVFTLAEEAVDKPQSNVLEKAQLLRVPNQRSHYPNGIRIRLSDGTLLAPVAINMPPQQRPLTNRESESRDLTLSINPGFDKRVAVWAVTMTRDGLTSRFTGPTTLFTAPRPLVAPALSVTPGATEDRLIWSTLVVPAEVSVERRADDGASWERVSPWLSVSQTNREIPVRSGGPRQYRLALRASGQRSAHSEIVTLT